MRTLFTQTKTEGVEFIFVNDCTPDDSIAVLSGVIEEFPHITIKIINHPHNMHIAKTRQTGIDASVGEYTI